MILITIINSRTELAPRLIQSESRDVRPSVCVSVCVSPPSEIYFEGLVAPTYKSIRQFLFVFLDSLKKSYGKDVVSD